MATSVYCGEENSDESLAEKANLRKELLAARSLLNQLLHESSQEKFDERRVNMLKAQVIQLERQMVLLCEAASSRADVLIEVDNVALHIRNTISNACSSNPRSSDVTVPRSELMKIIQLCETLQGKVAKTSKQSSKDILWAQPLTRSKFAATKTSVRRHTSSSSSASAPRYLLDVCTGKFDHLGLSAVSSLEARLCSLYKQLRGLEAALKARACSCGGAEPAAARLNATLDGCAKSVASACGDLLDLSLLVPSAPWGAHNSPLLPLLTETAAGATVASLAKARSTDVKAFLHAVTKAASHQCTLAALHVQGLEQELEYHKRVYEVQVKYVTDLLDGLLGAYKAFAADLHTALHSPISEILLTHAALKTQATEGNLRTFFTAVKQNADKLETVLQSIHRDISTDACEAFAGYSGAFERALGTCKANAEAARNIQLAKIAEATALEDSAAEAQLAAIIASPGMHASSHDTPCLQSHPSHTGRSEKPAVLRKGLKPSRWRASTGPQSEEPNAYPSVPTDGNSSSLSVPEGSASGRSSYSYLGPAAEGGVHARESSSQGAEGIPK